MKWFDKIFRKADPEPKAVEPEVPKAEPPINPFAGSANPFASVHSPAQQYNNMFSQQQPFQQQYAAWQQMQAAGWNQQFQQWQYQAPRPQLTPEELKTQEMAPVWRQTLGFAPNARVTMDEVDDVFRTLAKKWHPDHGGDPDQMKQINLARAWAKRELSAIN